MIWYMIFSLMVGFGMDVAYRESKTVSAWHSLYNIPLGAILWPIIFGVCIRKNSFL